MKRDSELLAVLASLALLVACPDATEEHEDAHEEGHEEVERISLTPEAYEAAGIDVAPAVRRTVVPEIQVTGTLSYDERKTAVATARIGGRIARVVADYGQRVAAGEALAWIDSPELGAAQAEYRRAWSMARLGRAEHERAELLLQGEAISRGELLRREAEWRAAEAELQTTEQKLHILGLSQDDVEALSRDEAEAGHVYPVRASIGGRVTERHAVPGRVVSPDDELFTIADLGTLWLFLQVFEKDLPAVREGSRVTLSCESHPEDRFSGTVDFVGEVLDPHSRTVPARAVIDNPDGTLKPGMFVYVQVEGGSHREAAPETVAVPKDSVVSLEGRDVVFVESGERAFEARPVVVGVAAGEWVEIRSGLTEGERVAVSGTFTLKSEALKGGLEEHHH